MGARRREAYGPGAAECRRHHEQKLDQERDLFSRLSVQQMEAVAAESQALVDKAMAMARANANVSTLDDKTSRRALVEDDGRAARAKPQCTGNDVERSVEGDAPLNRVRR